MLQVPGKSLAESGVREWCSRTQRFLPHRKGAQAGGCTVGRAGHRVGFELENWLDEERSPPEG